MRGVRSSTGFSHPVERLLYRLIGTREDARNELEDLCAGDAGIQRFGAAGGLCLAARSGVAAAQPAGSGCGVARFGVQHGGQLRQQYQLAGLRRRNDHELSDADGRADRAELRLGGDRHGDADRADSRAGAAHDAGDRQLLGRSDAHDPLHPAAAVDHRRADAGVAGRRADLRQLLRRRSWSNRCRMPTGTPSPSR